MADRFAFNTRVIPQLMNHPNLRHVLKDMAEFVAEEAREIAPVDEGDYRDSLDSTVIFEDGMTKGIAFSDDYKALLVEFGTVDTPAFAPLRRALDRLRGGFDI